MILFADCEGDNLVDDITRLWTIQIAEEETGFVEVYADQYGYCLLYTSPSPRDS